MCDRSRFTDSAMLVDRLARVLLYTNTARVRPTARTMARGLGCTERQASRYLAALERAGWPMPQAQPGPRE